MNSLLHYIEEKERSETKKGDGKDEESSARRNAEFILRYRNTSPSFEFDRNLSLSKDENSPGHWKLDNVSSALDVDRKIRRPVRSYDYIFDKKRRRKRDKRKRKKRKRKKRKRRVRNANGTAEYRKLARRAAMIRQKRDDNLEDEWDQFDFKYEKPEIYKSMSILNDPNG